MEFIINNTHFKGFYSGIESEHSISFPTSVHYLPGSGNRYPANSTNTDISYLIPDEWCSMLFPSIPFSSASIPKVSFACSPTTGPLKSNELCYYFGPVSSGWSRPHAILMRGNGTKCRGDCTEPEVTHGDIHT